MSFTGKQYIKTKDGVRIVLTRSEYRVLYYASICEVKPYFSNYLKTGKGYALFNKEGEPVTKTVQSLLRKDYLSDTDGGVTVTALGRHVMRLYWERRNGAE